jgi:hypothetical protein
MFSKLRPGLTYGNVIATLALFLALGGGAYAALKLPKKSVGAKQLKPNAVRSAKVKDASLLRSDFKPGELPTAQEGPKGDRGDACPSTDPACRGAKGDTGDRGPGTLSFDGQFDRDNNIRVFATVEGMNLWAGCEGGTDAMHLMVRRVDEANVFHAWGTRWTGSALERAPVQQIDPYPGSIRVDGSGTAELDVVAKATPAGTDGRYTRIDMSGIVGAKCNYHALVIPPS